MSIDFGAVSKTAVVVFIDGVSMRRDEFFPHHLICLNCFKSRVRESHGPGNVPTPNDLRQGTAQRLPLI